MVTAFENLQGVLGCRFRRTGIGAADRKDNLRSVTGERPADVFHIFHSVLYPICEMELTSLLEVQELEANQKMTKSLTLAKSSPDAK